MVLVKSLLIASDRNSFPTIACVQGIPCEPTELTPGHEVRKVTKYCEEEGWG